jgi:hypothetical protein
MSFQGPYISQDYHERETDELYESVGLNARDAVIYYEHGISMYPK